MIAQLSNWVLKKSQTKAKDQIKTQLQSERLSFTQTHKCSVHWKKTTSMLKTFQLQSKLLSFQKTKIPYVCTMIMIMTQVLLSRSNLAESKTLHKEKINNPKMVKWNHFNMKMSIMKSKLIPSLIWWVTKFMNLMYTVEKMIFNCHQLLKTKKTKNQKNIMLWILLSKSDIINWDRLCWISLHQWPIRKMVSSSIQKQTKRIKHQTKQQQKDFKVLSMKS